MFKGAHFIRGLQGPLAIGQADTLASPPLPISTQLIEPLTLSEPTLLLILGPPAMNGDPLLVEY
jgi:hypothetical protein